MPIYTSNFNFAKPLVNDPTDQDIWGGELNGNFDTLDSALKVARDRVTQAITTSTALSETQRKREILVDATAGNVVLTSAQPSVVGSGYEVTIKKIDASANTVTIAPFAAETFDGAASIVLSTQYDVRNIVTNGTNWFSNTPAGTPLASTAETQAGSITTKAVTPGALKGALGFSNFFQSSNQTVTIGTQTTVPHTLGVVPIWAALDLVCTTAEQGYSVGDHVGPAIYNFDAVTGSSRTYGYGLVYNTSNFYIITGPQGINIPSRTGGVAVTITPADWAFVIKAGA